MNNGRWITGGGYTFRNRSWVDGQGDTKWYGKYYNYDGAVSTGVHTMDSISQVAQSVGWEALEMQFWSRKQYVEVRGDDLSLLRL